jgi:hypothetical protein
LILFRRQILRFGAVLNTYNIIIRSSSYHHHWSICIIGGKGRAYPFIKSKARQCGGRAFKTKWAAGLIVLKHCFSLAHQLGVYDTLWVCCIVWRLRITIDLVFRSEHSIDWGKVQWAKNRVTNSTALWCVCMVRRLVNKIIR